MNWSATIDRYIAEGRTVSGGKGDSTANSTEKAEGQFTNTLQQAFTTNNANQQNQLNFLNSKLQSSINNPQGYSPATLAAMRAQATDQQSSQTQDVQRAVNNGEAVRGGSTSLPSGVNQQINAEIATQGAENENAVQQGITTQNANLQQENYNNAVTGEMGVAGMENPEGMAGESSGAAGAVSNLSNAVTASSGPTIGSILGSLGSAAAGAAGTAL